MEIVQLWSQRHLGLNTGLATHWHVTFSKSGPLSELWFPHLWNENNTYLRGLSEWNEGVASYKATSAGPGIWWCTVSTTIISWGTIPFTALAGPVCSCYPLFLSLSYLLPVTSLQLLSPAWSVFQSWEVKVALPVIGSWPGWGIRGVLLQLPVYHLWQLGCGASRSIMVVVMVGVLALLLVLMLA